MKVIKLVVLGFALALSGLAFVTKPSLAVEAPAAPTVQSNITKVQDGERHERCGMHVIHECVKRYVGREGEYRECLEKHHCCVLERRECQERHGDHGREFRECLERHHCETPGKI